MEDTPVPVIIKTWFWKNVLKKLNAHGVLPTAALAPRMITTSQGNTSSLLSAQGWQGGTGTVPAIMVPML